jgi:hypothetical protein
MRMLLNTNYSSRLSSGHQSQIPSLTTQTLKARNTQMTQLTIKVPDEAFAEATQC